MEKLLNSHRALCLSIFTVSRWMDNPQTKDEARKIPFDKYSLVQASPGSTFSAPTGHFLQQNLPVYPILSHPWNVGCWERQSLRESQGNRRVAEVRAGGWRRGSLLGQPGHRKGKRGVYWKAETSLTFDLMRAQLSGTPPLCLSLYWSWPPILRKAMIQEKEAEPTGCVIQ